MPAINVISMRGALW